MIEYAEAEYIVLQTETEPFVNKEESSRMKYRIVMALVCLSLSSAAMSTTLCQQKEQDIQQEISHAEQHGNQYRLRGLNKALSEVKEHCIDEKLRADHQKKIARQNDEIAERQRDLAEARAKGDPDKIATRERKLAEAHKELKALESHDY